MTERYRYDPEGTAYSQGRRDGYAAGREKVADFMLRNSIATGHGDTIDDLLAELQAVWTEHERNRKSPT